MKDQGQQPPNANPNARGPTSTTTTQGQTGIGTPTAPNPDPTAGVPLGANAGLAATRAREGENAGTQSFAQQGYAGVPTPTYGPQMDRPDQGGMLPPNARGGAPRYMGAPDQGGMLPPNVRGGVPRYMDAPDQGGMLPPGARGGTPRYMDRPMDTGPMLPPTTPTQGAGAPLPTGRMSPVSTGPLDSQWVGGTGGPSGSGNSGGGSDLYNAMKDAQDAAYKNATGYLDPQWQNAQTALENRLANQGVVQNSEAWNKAMDDFARQKEFAYSQARSGAVAQGNTAHGQLFSEGLAGAQFSNTVREQLVQAGFTQQQIDNLEAQHRFDNSYAARNQALNELLLGQNNPLQMYQALMNGTSVTQPNFTNAPGANMNPADILAAIMQAYSGGMNTYNAQMGSTNSNNAAIAAIIAAMIGG